MTDGLTDLGFFILLLGFGYVLYQSYMNGEKRLTKESERIDHYENHKMAYKVGIIVKEAEEKDVQLVFPSESDMSITDMLEKEVQEDLKN